MTQNPSHKTKLDIVADSIQCSTEDILAYGDVKLFVYYNEEAQKVCSPHFVMTMMIEH